VTADSAAAAEALVRRMCEQLLANPVTEDFVIEVEAR
jgi:phosphoribosylformylglycinamidine (FGAM) synthase PurS component